MFYEEIFLIAPQATNPITEHLIIHHASIEKQATYTEYTISEDGVPKTRATIPYLGHFTLIDPDQATLFIKWS